MKKLLVLPLAFGMLLSCGEQTAEDVLNDVQSEANSLTEGGMSDVEFNDALVSESTLIDIELFKITDLDEKNVPEAEFRTEIKASLEVMDKVDANLQNVDASFSGGPEFLEALKNLSQKSRKLIEFYQDNATILSKSEEEWTEEELNNFNLEYDNVFDGYSNAHDNFATVQEKYASYNNIQLFEDKEHDAETIYNNTTAEEISH